MMKSFRGSLSLSLLAAGLLTIAACSNQGADPAAVQSAAPAAQPEPVQPSNPWQGTSSIKPVFPNEADAKEMKLDYETYLLEGSGLTVTPLPPHVGRSVDVQLTDAASTYAVVAGRADCGYKLKLTLGEGEAKLLDPKQNEQLVIGAESFSGASSVLLHIALEDGAKQNWSCSVHIEAKP